MILDHADLVPPFLCRLYARTRNGRASASCRDIAVKSGLSKSKVAAISVLVSWKTVAVKDVDAFAGACGVDFDNPHKVAEYFRKSRMTFLAACHPNQKRLFAKLMRLGIENPRVPHRD